MAEVVSNREVIDHDAAAAQQRQGGALDGAEPMQAAGTNAPDEVSDRRPN